MADPTSSRGSSDHSDNYELPIAGFKGTPEEIERQWYEQCYKGRGDSMLQLTWRAVLMGSVLGSVLSLTNLYIGLKAGWAFGVAITACILSYAIWTFFLRIGIARTPMTILENNCMQSTASSAGYSTGGTLISAFAAFMMINNTTLPMPLMFAWVFFLAVLGVTMAIPMKRQMINIEQLRFPTGVAAAETLRALHSQGGQGMRSAQALGIAGLLAAISKFLTDGLVLISKSLEPFQLSTWFAKASTAVFGQAWVNRTVMFHWEPMFLAAGAITGVRVCASMMLGAVLCWMVFVPIGLERREIMLSVTETLVAPVGDVDFHSTPRMKKQLAYNPQFGSIKWTGPMLPEDRDALFALSPEPWYQNTIERLYVRSQYRASEPLAAPPAELPTTGPAASAVVYNAESRALEMPQLVSPELVNQLKLAIHDPALHAAVDSLAARSILPSFELLHASAELEAMPTDATIPEALADRLTHDAESGRLFWRGPISDADVEHLRAVSSDASFAAAVDGLVASAANRTLSFPIPAAAASAVRFDASVGALRALGPISTEAANALREAATDDPAAKRSIDALVAAGGAKRARENYPDLVAYTLWGGTACMVTSGLLAFLLQWRTALRAFAGFFALFRSDRKTQSELDAIEAPMAWFAWGQIVSLLAISWLAHHSFGMPYWQSVLAVFMTFALALVACRVTGETDTTPIGAMGKIMQLTFGAIHPARFAGDVAAMNTNLMAANITAGAAGSSADLLTDLKSGYLLGANPRRQFLAQFAGIFAGTIVTVLAFSVLIPNASVLGTDQFPAPAAQTWKGVAEALSQGIGALEPLKAWSIVWGGVAGIVLTILPMMLPARAGAWIPSAAGVGLAWVFHWFYALLFFVGSLIGWGIEKRWPIKAKEFLFPIAAGVIAGESLMGVGLIFWENGPEIVRKLFGL